MSYNEARWTRQFLKRHRKAPPSLVVHLYNAHFRFEQHLGTFSYDSPMKCFLEAIREQKLPTDLLDVLENEFEVQYYEGCLIVEVHDHRSATAPSTSTAPARPMFSISSHSVHARGDPTGAGAGASKFELFRIVLAPNPASLWTQLGIQERNEAERLGANAKPWTEEETVEMEAAILARTSAPLCLSPSLQVTRIANMMQLATASRPHKRKRSSNADADEDAGEEAARREREQYERMMKIGDESAGRPRVHPGFARLAFIQKYRESQNKATAEAMAQANGHQSANSAANSTQGSNVVRLGASAGASGASTPGAGASPAATKPKKPKATGEDGAPKKKKAKPSAEAAAAAAAGISLDPADPSLPLDPVEREKELAERKRLIAAKKRADQKQRAKEKKKREAAAAAAGQDLVVGKAATPSATPQARFTWSGAP